MLCFIVFIGGTSYASDSDDATVSALLEVSGVAAQLESIAKSVFSVIPADAFPDAGAKGKAEASVAAEAGPETLLRTVEEAVRANFQPTHAEEVLRFFSTPLGKKLRRASETSATPPALKEIQEGGTLVGGLSEARKKLLERIASTQESASFSERLVESSLQELLLGYSRAVGKNDSEVDQLRDQVEKARKAVSAQGDGARRMALAAAAVTFRTFSDSEVEEVAAYLESDSALWFRKVVEIGLNSAIPKLMKALGKGLAAQGG
jgi:hypothetical protein